MKKVKILFLACLAIGFYFLTGCSKSNNTNTTTKTPDSVYTSAWITLAMDSVAASQDWEQKIVAPAITSAVLQHGVLLGYGAFLNNNNDTVVNQALEFNMFQTFLVDTVWLQSGFNNSGLWYRYVVIPGHVLTTMGLTPMQARSLTYAELTKLIAPAAKKSESPTIQ